MSEPVKRPSRLVSSLVFMATTLLTVFLILHFFAYVHVMGISMEPTLQDGDRLIMLKESKPEAGQYLLFPMPESWTRYDEAHASATLIKRALAVPGDELSWDGKTLFVNGVASLNPGRACAAQRFTLTLRSNQAFVVGDNGPVSIDSRRVLCDGYQGYLVDLNRGWTSGRLIWKF